ncbi:Ldh family oxidoreductase [Microbacterium sp. NPDC028030]|uniref:Ldh family oxidoreductase n=1 Tax=Microbacterium sp. NPDC028030 TaxID=3155124 RepID=UPI0033CA4BB3
MNIDAEKAVAALRDLLRNAVPVAETDDVALAALWVLQAEMLGLPEFGIRMLRRDLDRLAGVDPAGSTPSDDDAAIGSVDATGVPGVVALATAVRRARRSVEAHGLAIIGIRGAGALGILGLAARSLAADGAVALLAAQSPASVAPWGAHTVAIGTNPLAVAVPRADAPPLVIDYATSALTLAAVREARASGARLPEGGAVDADGASTTDPDAVAALLPAGLVGSLTGLVVELLAGVAVGGRVTDPQLPSSRGALLIAFDPARAGGADTAAAASALDRDWRGAGGHLPARFDVLATDTADLPGSVDLGGDDVAWLRDTASGAARA